MNNAKETFNDTNKTTSNNTIIPDNFETDNRNSFSFAQLLKDGAKQGIKAVKLFALMILLFGISNLVFITIHILLYLTESEWANYNRTIYAIAIGIVFTAVSLAFTYKYILMNTIQLCYQHLEPFFKKICTKVIDIVILGGNKISGKDIHKSLNVGSLMIEVYGKKLPKYVQKGLMLVLEKIPFGDFLQTMHSELLNQKEDNQTLSHILYLQVDKFVSGSLFGAVTLKWIYWLLPLNIIIQILLIYIR